MIRLRVLCWWVGTMRPKTDLYYIGLLNRWARACLMGNTRRIKRHSFISTMVHSLYAAWMHMSVYRQGYEDSQRVTNLLTFTRVPNGPGTARNRLVFPPFPIWIYLLYNTIRALLTRRTVWCTCTSIGLLLINRSPNWSSWTAVSLHELELFLFRCEKRPSSHCATLLFYFLFFSNGTWTTETWTRKFPETDGCTPLYILQQKGFPQYLFLFYH